MAIAPRGLRTKASCNQLLLIFLRMYMLKNNLPVMLLSVNVRWLSETPGFQHITNAIHSQVSQCIPALGHNAFICRTCTYMSVHCTILLPTMEGRAFACLLVCSSLLQLDFHVDLVYDYTILPSLQLMQFPLWVVWRQRLWHWTQSRWTSLSVMTKDSLSWSTLWVKHENGKVVYITGECHE